MIKKSAILQELRTGAESLEAAVDKDVLGRFYKSTQKITRNDNLKAACTAVVIMGLVRLDQHAAARRIHADFVRSPSGEFYVSMLSPEQLSQSCRRCGGAGTSLQTCKSCKGKGACGNSTCKRGKVHLPTFNGTKIKTCSVCKGKDVCPECKGAKEAAYRCGNCNGRKFLASSQKEKQLFATYLSRAKGLMKPEVHRTAKPAVVQAPPGTVAESKDEIAKTIVPESEPVRAPIPVDFSQLASEEAILKNTGADKLLNLDETPEKLQSPTKDFGIWLANQLRREAEPWASGISAKYAGRSPELSVSVTAVFDDMEGDVRNKLCTGVHRFWKSCCKRNRIDALYVPVRFVTEDGELRHTER